MALSKSKPTNGKKKAAGSGKRRKEGTPEQQDTIKQQPVGKSVNYECGSRSYLRSQDVFGDFLVEWLMQLNRKAYNSSWVSHR